MEKAEDLRSLDYIFGPLAGDGIRKNNKNWKPIAFHNPMKYQLCLKTKLMADLFYNKGNNIENVIFFCDQGCTFVAIFISITYLGILKFKNDLNFLNNNLIFEVRNPTTYLVKIIDK